MARVFDIIQAPDQRPDQLVIRVPQDGWGDIRLGSQLVVGESQNAVFFRDGKALDTFGAGRHTLTTANVPLLIGLLGKLFSGESPFKASVYFVNMVDLLDLKWGTPEPIAVRDHDLGMVRLRGFGSYSIRVTDAQRFVAQVVGQRGLYSTNEIADWLRGQLVSAFADVLGESKAGLFDLPGLTDELSVALKAKVAESFEQSGITAKQVFVQSISATEDTSKAIDERAAMGAIGDMNAYLRFKAAQALGTAAAGTGQGGAGGAGEGMAAGVGLGAGIGLGAGLGGMVVQAMQGSMQPQAPAAAASQTATPQSKGDVQSLIDNLDLRLANGEIDQATYNRLVEKWQKRLDEMG